MHHLLIPAASCVQIYWLDFIKEADGIAEPFNKASGADAVRVGSAIYECGVYSPFIVLNHASLPFPFHSLVTSARRSLVHRHCQTVESSMSTV